MFNPEWEAKGREGEKDLKSWLDRNGFGYVAVCQARETFARLFADAVKRPDFLVLVDSIGILAVDAKNRVPFNDLYSLPHEEEFKRAILFERVFRLPVWYAYRGTEQDQWYWISALKAFEVGKKHGKGKESFLKIRRSDFVCIRSGADFGQLYTQRMPGFSKLLLETR